MGEENFYEIRAIKKSKAFLDKGAVKANSIFIGVPPF